MKQKYAIILAVFIIALILYASSQNTSAQTMEEWDIIFQKVDPCILKYLIPDTIYPLLPPAYVNFVTREAINCRLSLRVATLESGTVAKASHWTTCTREVTLSQISTWDAVNIENLIHELTHAGAGSAGSGEVAARKAEAESWKNASNKPSRKSGQDQSCWATYDMVYNKKGIQRSHDAIKKKLKTYGYSQSNM